jgi:hypothetical protein
MIIEKEFCKGGCGKLVIYNHWCTTTFTDCPGYKKKLSILAQKRGNYDIHKKMRKFTIEERKERCKKKIFNFICVDCKTPFNLEITTWAIEHPSFVPYCNSCKIRRRSDSYKLAWKRRRSLVSYELWTSQYRKEFIWEEQGKKCNLCGYNLYDLKTGPYQLHHKDSDSNNKKRENEEIICANCHQMTDSWGGKGIDWTEERRKRHRETHLNWFVKNGTILKY